MTTEPQTCRTCDGKGFVVLAYGDRTLDDRLPCLDCVDGKAKQ